MLKSFDEDSLAAELVFAELVPIQKVVFKTLRWSLWKGRMDHYEILGEVDMDDSFEVERDGRIGARPTRVAPPAEGSADDDDFDLLDDMMPTVRRAPIFHPSAAVHISEDFDPLQLLQQAILNIEDDDAVLHGDEVDDDESEDAGNDGDGDGPGDHDGDGDLAEAAEAPADAGDALPALRIHDRGRWYFHLVAPPGELVGRLHHLGATNLKATCRRHDHCVCVVSLPPPGSAREAAVGHAVTLADVERDLIRWLDCGVDQSALQHSAASRTIKADVYHMRVR
jgi:hypothetical protein